MQKVASTNILSTILRHDAKVTSYKIALLRALNDVALSYPNLSRPGQPVLVPLRVLAEFWIAYYWPFVEPGKPVWQGARSRRRSGISNDMAFRPALTHLRATWEQDLGVASLPSDGYVLSNELRSPRKRAIYSRSLQTAYSAAITAISKTIEEQPVRYAGPGEWSVFEKPARYTPSPATIALPGTGTGEKCLRLEPEIWQLFCDLSLWIEALCIHEWSLFTENVDQGEAKRQDRGDVYRLLTSRPDNRRPLTWERNQIEILLMEGHTFTCPWTGKHIGPHTTYDMDHLVPVSVLPINEMWNLVPADHTFNQHGKRDRLPTLERLAAAQPVLIQTYATYTLAAPIAQALFEDVELRFTGIDRRAGNFSEALAAATVAFIQHIAESRNIARF